jgi:hypothetical protein
LPDDRLAVEVRGVDETVLAVHRPAATDGGREELADVVQPPRRSVVP